jgi:hypothetical protein
MKTYILYNKKLEDGSRYIMQGDDLPDGWKKCKVDDSMLKPSGIKNHSIIEVEDDWDEWWYEDEERVRKGEC